MNGAARLRLAQHVEESPDLAPAAEMDVIAERARPVSARGRLARSVRSERPEELRRVEVRAGVGEIGVGDHERGYSSSASTLRQWKG